MSDYVLAKYLRISKHDKNNNIESQSITNQRSLIDNYIKNNSEFKNAHIIEFVDDGYSGTGFEQRPGIQNIFNSIKKGHINAIIVKDLSRFGRNYIDVGNYLRNVFTALNVRFISVNDNFDSIKSTDIGGDIDIIFKNIIHDIYSRDLSVKIRSGKKASSELGNFLGSQAFYGYVKDENNKGKLIVDCEAAEIVVSIFNYALEGLSYSDIARKLNKNKVLTPMQYKIKRFNINQKWNSASENKNYWTGNTVSRILHDERYTGKLISLKRQSTIIGGKRQTKAMPVNEWIVVDNTHEAIISNEVFSEVNNSKNTRIKNNIKNTNIVCDDNNGVINEKVICGYCGRHMQKCKSKDVFYVCPTTFVSDNNRCAEYIKRRILEHITGAIINTHLLLTDSFSKLSISIKQKDDYEKSISLINKQLKSLTNYKVECYEKFVKGIITKKSYLQIKSQTYCNIEALKQNLNSLYERQKEKPIDYTITQIENYLKNYIESIVVYSCTNIKINIKYKDITKN